MRATAFVMPAYETGYHRDRGRWRRRQSP